jgi:ATP-dependent DNA ligase
LLKSNKWLPRPLEEGQEIFRNAVIPLKLEGLVAKRTNSRYQPGIRSAD